MQVGHTFNQLFLVMLSSCALLFNESNAQTPAPTPTPLVEPSSSTAPDNTRYLNKPSLLEPCRAQVDAFKGECDLIFIGDSITLGWRRADGLPVWKQYYDKRHAFDFGIGGDKTQNVLWRLQNLNVSKFHPKVAVVLIGTNNTLNTPQEISDGVAAVLKQTQTSFPGVKIILVSILPNQRANDKMMQADGLIKPMADDQSIYYLDLVPAFPPVGDNWQGLKSDHLHLTTVGYTQWAQQMEPLLKKLLNEP